MATSQAGSTNSTGLTLMTLALGKGKGGLGSGRVPYSEDPGFEVDLVLPMEQSLREETPSSRVLTSLALPHPRGVGALHLPRPIWPPGLVHLPL